MKTVPRKGVGEVIAKRINGWL